MEFRIGQGQKPWLAGENNNNNKRREKGQGGKRLLSNQSLRNKERCDLKYYNLYLFLEENQDNCSEKKKTVRLTNVFRVKTIIFYFEIWCKKKKQVWEGVIEHQ